MVRLRPDVYVITEDRGPGRGHLDVARAALAGGATMLQLRDKDAPAAALYGLAVAVAGLCRAAGVPLIVNDRLDVALAAEADGVHLGQDDLPAREARRLLGPGPVLGVSAATPAEARAAEAAGADYVGVGPFARTRTKADAGEAVGPAVIRAIRAAVSIPVVAVGGIDAANAPAALAAGADGVAVVSAVSRAADMAVAVRALAAAVAAAKGGAAGRGT